MAKEPKEIVTILSNNVNLAREIRVNKKDHAKVDALAKQIMTGSQKALDDHFPSRGATNPTATATQVGAAVQAGDGSAKARESAQDEHMPLQDGVAEQHRGTLRDGRPSPSYPHTSHVQDGRVTGADAPLTGGHAVDPPLKR